jgi:5-formyltetrahydrofolate cyclo-ligase
MKNMTKKELRAAFKAARADMNEQERAARSREICTQILQSPLYADASCVLLYAATDEEIDLGAVAKDAWEKGKTVAYPRCEDREGRMTFYTVQSPEQLVSGSFGILEPHKDCPPWQSVGEAFCIVPALAVDAYGNRLGYGKGYYDRFLAGFEGVTACAVYEQCFAPELPREGHDLPVMRIIDRKGVRHVKEQETQELIDGVQDDMINDGDFVSE